VKTKTLLAVLMLCGVAALGAQASKATATSHRYVVERTFPKGALANLDADAKAQVNRTNAQFGVKWLLSYSNAERTVTYCIYEGPSPEAIRQAAAANHMTAHKITEVPVTLEAH
jgi:hypothetical protein